MDNNSPNPNYDFINQVGEEKKGFLAKANKKARIIIVFGGVGTLLLIGLILWTVLFGSQTDLSQELLRVAQRQQEIIRIAEIAEGDARSRNTSVYATTTKYSVTSSQQAVVSRLRVLGVQAPASILNAAESNNTTQELEQAAQANRFDDTYRQIMAEQLDAYEQAIRSAGEQARGSDLDLLRGLLSELETFRDNL